MSIRAGKELLHEVKANTTVGTSNDSDRHFC
jgi:hypothetical protein